MASKKIFDIFDKQFLLFFSVALIIIILDQITKYFVRKNMYLGKSIPIIKNIFHITYSENIGAGFSILKGHITFFIVVSIIVIILIFYYYKRIIKRKFTIISTSLMLGGCVGNLIDRLIFAKVTDFIDLRVWPIFNIADSALTIGVILLIVYIWRKK